MKPLNLPRIPPLGGKAPGKVQDLLKKAGSKLTDAAANALSGLQNHLKPGETIDDFAAELKKKAEEEAKKYQPLFALGRELCEDLKSGTRARRYLEEVIKPMQRKQLDGRSAVTRTNDIFGKDVVSKTKERSGPFSDGVTIAIGIGAALGCVVGFEKCYGLAMTGFAKTPRAFECWSRSLHVGTVEASVSGSIEFSPGSPEPSQPDFLSNSPLGEKAAGWDGWGIGYSVGGGYGATLAGAIGFKPNWLEPVHKWKFKSLAVQFGGGGGAELGMWLQGAVARELPEKMMAKP